MKQLLCTFLALTCAISLVSCGSSSDSSTSYSTVTNAFTTTLATSETSTTIAITSTTATVASTATTTTNTIPKTEPETSNVSFPNSTKEYVEYIGQQIEITDVITMAAEMIGAEEGTSFMYRGNKFEIYRFKDGDPQIEQAKSGFLTYNIEGFGEFTSSSSVNNDYVMIYDTPDDKVIEAFQNVS